MEYGNFKYRYVKKGIKITNYTETHASYVEIPQYMDIFPVIAIGIRVFWCCRNLKSVAIPNSVEEIGISAFEGCSSLTSIIIPDSITKIDDTAFLNCLSLKEIKFPSSKKKLPSLKKFLTIYKDKIKYYDKPLSTVQESNTPSSAIQTSSVQVPTIQTPIVQKSDIQEPTIPKIETQKPIIPKSVIQKPTIQNQIVYKPILHRIENLKNAPNISFHNRYYLNKFEIFLKSDDLYRQIDTHYNVLYILDNIFKKTSIENLIDLLNSVSENTTINCDFNQTINTKLFKFISEILAFCQKQR